MRFTNVSVNLQKKKKKIKNEKKILQGISTKKMNF